MYACVSYSNLLMVTLMNLSCFYLYANVYELIIDAAVLFHIRVYRNDYRDIFCRNCICKLKSYLFSGERMKGIIICQETITAKRWDLITEEPPKV